MPITINRPIGLGVAFNSKSVTKFKAQLCFFIDIDNLIIKIKKFN